MYKIPLALPKLNLENIPDETGFTILEKRALRNAWDKMKSKVGEHAREQSLRFLTENEDMLEKFRSNNGRFNIKALQLHPYKVFDALDSMILEGLTSSNTMNGLTKSIAVRHFHKEVEHDKIRRMTDHLSAYLKEVLRNVMSPTLERSINKICKIIILAHQ